MIRFKPLLASAAIAATLSTTTALAVEHLEVITFTIQPSCNMSKLTSSFDTLNAITTKHGYKMSMFLPLAGTDGNTGFVEAHFDSATSYGKAIDSLYGKGYRMGDSDFVKAEAAFRQCIVPKTRQTFISV